MEKDSRACIWVCVKSNLFVCVNALIQKDAVIGPTLQVTPLEDVKRTLCRVCEKKKSSVMFGVKYIGMINNRKI